MRLSIFILSIVPLLLCRSSFSQDNPIDSLKKLLPSLHDTARTDCLSDLSARYILGENKDSADHYALLAHAEARKQNYIHGIARSLSLQSQIAKHFGDDFIRSEKLAKESLQWYEKTGNKKGLDNLYFYLMYTVFSQSRFDEAIYYGQKKYELAQQAGDITETINALTILFAIYRQSGNYEKSFEFARRAYDLALKANDKIWISITLYGMAQLYTLIEDYPAALTYFRRVLAMDDEEIRKARMSTDNDIWFKMEFTEVFSRLNQFDSAWHYYKLFKPSGDKAIYMRIWWVSTGECYYLQKDYPHALRNLELGLAEHRKLNDRNEVMRALLDLGKVYVALNNNGKALQYGREGLSIALEAKSKQYIRDAYQILSTIYDRIHIPDSANFYFRKYITLKEEVLNDQAKTKFAVYEYDQKIALINKEKELQQARLEKETVIKKMLIAGSLLLITAGFIIFRNIALRRKNEKQRLELELEIQRIESERSKAELEQQAAELKMQALRAQMNPHFIFNSLNSINRFILQNNKTQASEYLTKFSKLVRMILQNSQVSLVTLENELEALRLYLDLEALRFEQHFDFRITVPDDMDIELLKVPPLILQPYVENSIWHGLMHKEEKGHLYIDISQDNNHLVFKIADDGIGRKQAAASTGKKDKGHQSMGLKLTANRISIVQQLNGNETPVIINDLINADGSPAGTEVIIKIPVIYGQNN